MNRAQSSYQQQAADAWTRIDMLLALYTRAEDYLKAMQTASEAELPLLRIKASKVLMGIRQGLDFRYGDLPDNVDVLCIFVQQQIWDGEVEQWEACQRILGTLREGFAGIRDEAAELERTGQIPTATQDSSWERLA